MASLGQTLNKNKPLVRQADGSLAEDDQTTQQLAGQQGLSASPTTPLGVAVLGGNSHQQKMAGTPNQKEAAVTQATEPGQSLQDTLRRQQIRTTADTGEQAQMEKSQDMQNLGQVGQRVTDFIETQRQILQEQALKAGATNQGVEVKGVDQWQGKDVKASKDILARLRANPGDQQAMLELNKAMGSNISIQLSPDQINQLYESAVSAIARGGAGNVDNDLNVQDLVGNPEFGYDINGLSQLLGVPPEQLAGYNVGQLRSVISQVADREFANVSNLENQATSTQLGQAERQLARGAAREASRVGTRASEADVQRIEQSIANADQIAFGGQMYQVDDLLQDDTISKLITDYMQAPPESPMRAQLEATEPELINFIRTNENVLADAAHKLSGSAQTFQQTQQFNRELNRSLTGGIQLDDRLMKSILPDWGEMRADQVDVGSVPMLSYARAIGADKARGLANNINDEVNRDPQTAQEMSGLSAQQLGDWQIESAQPDSNWQKFYIQPKRFFEQVSATDPDKPDHLVDMAAKDTGGARGAQNKMNANRASNTLGFGSSLNTGILDNDGDGLVDDGATLKKNLLAANPRPSLSSGPSNQKVFKAESIGTPSIPTDPMDKQIWDKLSGAAIRGNVGESDLRSVPLDLDELIRLQDLNGRGVDRPALDRLQGEKRDGATNQLISDIRNRGGITIYDMGILLQQELEKQGPRRVNEEFINRALDELAAADKQLADERADRAGARGRASEAGKLKYGGETLSNILKTGRDAVTSVPEAILPAASKIATVGKKKPW